MTRVLCGRERAYGDIHIKVSTDVALRNAARVGRRNIRAGSIMPRNYTNIVGRS